MQEAKNASSKDGLVAPCAEHIMRRARARCVREVVACTGGRAAVLHICAGPRARGRRAPWRTARREPAWRAVPDSLCRTWLGDDRLISRKMWARDGANWKLSKIMSDNVFYSTSKFVLYSARISRELGRKVSSEHVSREQTLPRRESRDRGSPAARSRHTGRALGRKASFHLLLSVRANTASARGGSPAARPVEAHRCAAS